MKTCPNLGVPGAWEVTVMAEVPVLPSLVAVMVAGPAATPVTSPLPFTVANAVALLDQVTTRPGRGVPFASLGVAVSWTVLPASTLAEAGVTVTEATGTTGTSTTVMAEVPVLPSLVAVIVAGPAARPVTSPRPFTVANAVASLDQVTGRPWRAVPFASLGVAVSWTVLPASTLADAGVTVTEATCTTSTLMTVIAELPVLLPV